LYGFAPQQFTREQKQEINRIIATRLGPAPSSSSKGKGKSRKSVVRNIGWCTFQEAKNQKEFDTAPRCGPEVRSFEVSGPEVSSFGATVCVKLHMMSSELMDAYLAEKYSQDAASLRGMSFTIMDRWRPVIYFNGSNWDNVDGRIDHFKGDMAGYHAYVVMHELYHALGFRIHIEPHSVAACKWPKTRPLNVLCQQTRGDAFLGLGQFVSSRNETKADEQAHEQAHEQADDKAD
jgi:hypothetical protein